MNLIRCAGYEEMSHLASTEILGELQRQPASWLCAATGYSPLGTYRNLVEQYNNGASGFDSLGIVKLDEWWGIPSGTGGSCEAYLRKELLSPIGFTQDRYISFQSDAEDPEQECLRIQNELNRHGPLDICLLGLGKNGHLGLNEPADQLTPDCHVSRLAPDSMQHTMLETLQVKPTLGLTLGIADILRSRRIILLVCGEGKKAAYDAFMQHRIDTRLPVSLLWLHPEVSCYLDVSSVS